MNSKPEQIIQETFTASNEGKMDFGEVVGRLIEAGVESYTVDYRTCQTTYYLMNNDAVILDMGPLDYSIADTFSTAGIQSAIRGAQQGTVMYPEFKRLSMQSGCTGYTVWIAGRHVTYYGRKGETHVEHFPVNNT